MHNPPKRVLATKLLALSIAACLAAGCASAKKGGAAASAAPSALAAARQAASEMVSKDVMTRYSVAEGDHLWGISSMPQIYSDPYQWPLIYRANTDDIQDADLIFPGQVLVIPRNVSASETAAADRHARNRGAWTLGVTEDADLAYLQQ